MNGAIYALRLKLSDFINDPLESSVVDKIHEIYKIQNFKLQLWYDDGEVTAKGLKSFIEKYERILHYKTTIRPNRDATTFPILDDARLHQRENKKQMTMRIR